MIKISRPTAIFEFSSSNGHSFFTVIYECRDIQLIDTGSENQNNFSYLVLLPIDWYTIDLDGPDPWYHVKLLCEERGFEKWKVDSNRCITSFQGEKCSMM